MLGWLKRCKLARVFLWEHSYQRLKLAQRLGQLGASLTWAAACGGSRRPSSPRTAAAPSWSKTAGGSAAAADEAAADSTIAIDRSSTVVVIATAGTHRTGIVHEKADGAASLANLLTQLL